MTIILFCLTPSFASEEKGKVDVNGTVLGHIKDSYEWHIFGSHENAVVIHLPIIVYSSQTGWHTFLSDKILEGKVYEGLTIAEEGPNAGKVVELADGQEHSVFDISITKTVCVLFIDSLLLLLIILLPARWYKKRKPSDAAPGGFTGFIEMLVMYVMDNMIEPSIGKGYEKYAPYLLTCFFFIFTCNVLGIIPFPPFGGNLTGNIACTFFLALCTFIVTQFSGTKHYWKDIFWPEVPFLLKCPVPLMPVIEFVGIFTKPFALMIRLFANMMAGHAIALSITCVIFVAATMGYGMLAGLGFVSILMSIFMLTLECLVCFIQAMVFTQLSATFIGLARLHPEAE
jgi:F-type H+-transporting ATPase subunit a